MQINFDHINTSQVSKTVLNQLSLFNKFNSGNSSQHAIAQESKLAIENARTVIAKKVDTFPGEIIFSNDEYQTYTSLFEIWNFLEIKTIITSYTEPTFFLNLLYKYAKKFSFQISFVNHNKSENIDLFDLEKKLNSKEKKLIHLSHINLYNSKFIPVKKIIKLSKKYKSLVSLNLSYSLPIVELSIQKNEIDFAFFSSAQLHGLNGIQAMYIKHSLINDKAFYSIFCQTKREFNTSNIILIKAFEIALTNYGKNFISNEKKIIELKSYFIQKIQNTFLDNEIILISDESSISNFFVLSLPFLEYIVQKLDSKGISISTLVTTNIFNNRYENRSLILVSFSKYNNYSEIDYFIKELKEIINLHTNNQHFI